MLTTTTLIIIATSVISVAAFPRGSFMPESLQRPEWFNKMKFNPYLVAHNKELYRLYSHGLIHADYWHLIFNMMTLYFFGDFVDQCFQVLAGPIAGKILFLVLYITALDTSCLIDMAKNHNNPGYNAVGASGAISAVLFAAILLNPTMKIAFLFVPIPIPAWLFGILYLIYCIVMARRGGDNIGHTAHATGAVYGLLFTLVLRVLA